MSLIYPAIAWILLMPVKPAINESSAWLAHSLKRYYPTSPVENRDDLFLEVARHERASFQVVIKNGLEVAEVGASVDPLSGVTAQVRSIGYVPLAHFNSDTPQKELEGVGYVPGFVPDPLFDETTVTAGPLETNAFWVTLRIARDAKPGSVTLPIKVTMGLAKKTLTVRLNIHKAVLPARKDFPVTHWFYTDALCDYYKVEPFEEAFWPIVDRYMANMMDHGEDVLHVPIFTPPTDGVKRPTQLLKVTRNGDKYVFDWSDVKRYIEMAKANGFHKFEWAHFFSQWGCKSALRIYETPQEDEKLLWPAQTEATSPVYRDFLEQFMPEFEKFLDAEGVREGSLFHISDEPDGDDALKNYRAARQMIREIAPWMKVMDALSHIAFAKEGLVDYPIPSIRVAPEFVKAGYPAWAYFCSGPRGEYLQRLLDTPLAKIRMSGWLLYKLGAKGFLHWGYNYWYVSQTRSLLDPFMEQAGAIWPSWGTGDPFLVYPGRKGPIDSIRWEVFAESLQDYALLQAAGVLRSDKALASLRNYAKFPKNAEWILRARKEMLDRLDEKK
jgi:hypothetical protein